MKKLIRNMGELKKLAGNEAGVNCCILLEGGLRSSKNIIYDSEIDQFWVFSFIDNSEQELTEEELTEGTNIVKAMYNNCLIQE